MDPDRVKAYLQVACAGLGFDIGEIWWTTHDSRVASGPTIEEDVDGTNKGQLQRRVRPGKRLRFVQLYTSKSFENRRSQLVNPDTEEGPNGFPFNGESDNLQKHVLSPRLVDVISNTAQVIWANAQKQEGLTGRSDICLQTAVGMPVAIDGNGNMCVVVMFSPNNIQSSDDALEYLHCISQSATSANIPCLLPVVSNASGLQHVPHTAPNLVSLSDSNTFGDGVSARFVSFDDNMSDGTISHSFEPEIHRTQELFAAPKDTFGIPMLPSFAELGNVPTVENMDPFDEASYGIWSTIMDSLQGGFPNDPSAPEFDLQTGSGTLLDGEAIQESNLQGVVLADPDISDERRMHLEEFCSAFLGMSTFDLADVWVPAGEKYPDCLRHVMAVTVPDGLNRYDDFMNGSVNTLIAFWTGAVGRAFASGNPVWSANPNVFVDPGRMTAFQDTNISTVLAIPVFSGKERTPACVVAFYSHVRVSSVPFVLRFVQQALRLLWDGLEHVQPHSSVDEGIWQDVAPADLGEMAADVEMHQHFMAKKRPYSAVVESSEMFGENHSSVTQLQQLTLPNGDMISVPFQIEEVQREPSPTPYSGETFKTHVADAVRNVVLPLEHISTNTEGTKRAHIMGPISAQRHSPLPSPNCLPTQVITTKHARNVPTLASNGDQVLQSLKALFPANVAKDYTMRQPNEHMKVVAQQQSTPVPAQSTSPMGQYCMAVESPEEPKPLEVTSGNKICRIQGCGELAVSRRPYCVKHSGNRLCEYDGCTKCAQGSTRFCIAHGGGRRCTFPGCDKGARDKYFCAAHGGGKRCSFENCTKSAVGGSKLCTAHGGGRRCSVDGCNKSAQSSTKYCVKHGGGKKCAHVGCEKVARGRTLYCASHGGGVRCRLEGCNRVAIGKMQLCRAHGGGSRNGKKRSESEAADPGFVLQLQQDPFMNQITPSALAVDYMTNM